MSNKLLLNLLQQKAQRQAYGGCMNGGVFTEAQRAKAKETRALNTIIMDDYINNTYGELSKAEMKKAVAKYKRDQKILKGAQPKVPRVRKERDPNQPRKKYPRKPNINESRIMGLMRERKQVDLCGFTPASLRQKGQEQRIANLEAEVKKLTTLQQKKKIKNINKTQRFLKHDPTYDYTDSPSVLVEEVKQAVADQEIPIEVAEILIEQIDNGELSSVAEVAEAVAEVYDRGPNYGPIRNASLTDYSKYTKKGKLKKPTKAQLKAIENFKGAGRYYY
jgi:hypothetical protein